jgi:hypothetical protein
MEISLFQDSSVGIFKTLLHDPDFLLLLFFILKPVIIPVVKLLLQISSVFSFINLFFCGTEVWTRSVIPARKALYHLSHSASPINVLYFIKTNIRFENRSFFDNTKGPFHWRQYCKLLFRTWTCLCFKRGNTSRGPCLLLIKIYTCTAYWYFAFQGCLIFTFYKNVVKDKLLWSHELPRWAWQQYQGGECHELGKLITPC